MADLRIPYIPGPPLSCPTCKPTPHFPTLSDRNAHYYDHHILSNTRSTRYPPRNHLEHRPSLPGDPLTCPKCRQRYESEYQRDRHYFQVPMLGTPNEGRDEMRREVEEHVLGMERFCLEPGSYEGEGEGRYRRGGEAGRYDGAGYSGQYDRAGSSGYHKAGSSGSYDRARSFDNKSRAGSSGSYDRTASNGSRAGSPGRAGPLKRTDSFETCMERLDLKARKRR